MPNVGVQIFAAAPTKLVAQAGADVTCAAGAATTALSVGGVSTAVIAGNVGSWLAKVHGVIFIDLGATAPSAMVISYATTAGTAIDSITVPASQLVNSAHLQIPIFLLDVASATKWLGSGATPLIQVNPTGQAVTAKLGSVVLFELPPGA